MALTKREKADLARYVKRNIELGLNIETSCLRLIPLGYKESTIREYYKTFSRRSNDA